MNDWSARDIQNWEYQPLGPFLGKNFATSISPWIITLEALEPFKISAPIQNPSPLSYLNSTNLYNYDIPLQVQLTTSNGKSKVISNSNMKYLYWTITQQLAHHSISGCNMKVGDLCGTGTISGPEPGSFGSLLELSWNGSKPLQIDTEERTFLQDGDMIALSGFCEKGPVSLGFGNCSGKII